jgi:hypothetical protein
LCGGEEDLERRITRETWNWAGLFGGQSAEPIFKAEARPLAGQLTQKQGIAYRQLGAHVSRDARGEVGASVGVQWDGQHTTQNAAMEGGNPLGAILGPEQHAVAGADLALGQQRGKAPCKAGYLAIGRRPPPVALAANDSNLAVVTAEVVEQCSQMIAHEGTGKFMVSHRAGLSAECVSSSAK